MTIYQRLAVLGTKYIGRSRMFKYGFNWSPMYRRSTAKIISVSNDLMKVSIKLPISYKNRNYVGSIFGGSLFSSVDPIPMVQLINLIGDDYVVWDKSAEIKFIRPARENLYAHFEYTADELDDIRQRVADEQEIEIIKTTKLMDKSATTLYCQVAKTIYIADKAYFKNKRARKNRTGKDEDKSH